METMDARSPTRTHPTPQRKLTFLLPSQATHVFLAKSLCGSLHKADATGIFASVSFFLWVDREQATRYHDRRYFGRSAEVVAGKECLDGMEEVVFGRRAGDRRDLDGVVGQKSLDHIDCKSKSSLFAIATVRGYAKADRPDNIESMGSFVCALTDRVVEGGASAYACFCGKTDRLAPCCDGKDPQRCV